MKLGTNDIGSVYLGTNAVQKVYLGTNEVWSAVDPDAQAFFDRVTTAGGSLSTTEQEAVNTLVVQMKADGIWSKMKAIYPMVGASAAACAQNLKSSSFTGTFTAGWTFASTGATPNGTSAYMDTFLVCDNVLTYGSVSVAYYSRTNSSGNFSDIGSYGNVGNSFKSYNVQCRQATGLARSASYDGNGTLDWATLSVTDSLGFFLANRQSTTNNKMIRNNTVGVVNAVNIAYGARSNPNSSYIGAANNFGAIQYTNRECAFASIGDGLTDTNASDFYTAVQAFQTTLSRQV